MTLQDLADREAIRDRLMLYCRGIDRVDEAALRQVYWPEAVDDHVIYSGPAEGFIAFAMNALRQSAPAIHQLHNILIDLRGTGAAVETYFSAWQELPTPKGLRRSHQRGRYLDWFEKRGDEWRVLTRKVVFDFAETLPVGAEPTGPQAGEGRRWPDDPVYALTSSSAGS